MKEIDNELKLCEDTICNQCKIFLADAGKDSKAAHARMRKATLAIAKLGKEFRHKSLAADKNA